MRPAWSGLKARGQANVPGRTPTVVLGRRYCPDCGRWRQLCDFPHRRKGAYSYCRVCTYRRHRAHLLASPEAQERKREDGRFRWERIARERGIPRRNWRTPRPPVPGDRNTYLDAAPLAAELARWDGHQWALAELAGLPARAIYRIESGEVHYVQLDTADRLALALDVPLALIYPEEA